MNRIAVDPEDHIRDSAVNGVLPKRAQTACFLSRAITSPPAAPKPDRARSRSQQTGSYVRLEPAGSAGPIGDQHTVCWGYHPDTVSSPKTKFDFPVMRDRIRAALEASPDFTDEEAREITFHMLDWETELAPLVDLFLNPSSHTDQEIMDVLTGFLVHAPNHIAAASKLFRDIGVEDIFEVGAVEVENAEKDDGE